MLVWMDEKSMELNQNYDIKRGTSVVPGSFEHINYKVDVNTFERKQVHKLDVNDIASCKMVLKLHHKEHHSLLSPAERCCVLLSPAEN